MAEHSYHQYCPVAHALDLVGDRWSLLIIRDLLVGPKRFVDLQNGLPGLGTNILTARLKWLEQYGVIYRHFLPPPAASMVYELTEYGRQLEEPLSALARWGTQTLGALTPEQVIEPDAVMMALHGIFRRIAGEQATYEIQCEDVRFREAFRVQVHASNVEVIRGHVSAPDVEMHMTVETLYALSSQRLLLHNAMKDGLVSLKGSEQAIAHLVERL
jgi:DNA-binding HxlR family transcriptional regulator